MFRTVPLSIIRSYALYTQQWYMSYRFADCLLAGSGCSLILLASCQKICMTYTIAVCTVKNSWWWTEELSETCRVLFQEWIWEISASSWFYYRNSAAGSRSCSQAVCISVWHIPLLCVQWKTPDDGHRNCPKHVEFHSKNEFEKLVHPVDFITGIQPQDQDPARKLSAYLYDIYHCCVYSEKLLMMDRGTVRNM